MTEASGEIQQTQAPRSRRRLFLLYSALVLSAGVGIGQILGYESYEEAIRRKLSETGIVAGPALLPIGQINGISHYMEIICPDSFMDEKGLQDNLQQQLDKKAELLIKSDPQQEMITQLIQQAGNNSSRLIAACLPR